MRNWLLFFPARFTGLMENDWLRLVVSYLLGLVVVSLASWTLTSIKPGSEIMVMMTLGTCLFALYCFIVLGRLFGGGDRVGTIWRICRISLLFTGIFMWWVLAPAMYPSPVEHQTQMLFAGSGAFLTVVAFFLMLPW